MPKRRPFKSLTFRIGSRANSSKQPRCSRPSAVIEGPHPDRMDDGADEADPDVDVAMRKRSAHIQAAGRGDVLNR